MNLKGMNQKLLNMIRLIIILFRIIGQKKRKIV